MTDTTIYDSINSLADIGFIGGTDKELSFVAYHENGIDLLNVADCPISWFLCPYGEFSQNVLEYTTEGISPNGRIEYGNSTGEFTVIIPAADTLTLSGKFIQQIAVTDYQNHTFRPAQGVVIISPAIQT